MRNGKTRLTFAVLAGIVTATIVGSAAVRQGSDATGPTYSLEGAWYGTVTIAGRGPTPSLDTFTSNAQKQGAEGSALCTIPIVVSLPHPLHPADPAYWLGTTPSAHGNWVRIGTNTYAFSKVRTIYDQKGKLFGWARFWGTITPTSVDEYIGTMNSQFYVEDGTPFSPLFTGTMHSRRIEIIPQQ
jgi:hypothetical protein